MTTTCTNPTCSITLAPGATTCWLCGAAVGDEIGAIVDVWATSPFPHGHCFTLVEQENAGIRQLAEMAYEAGRASLVEEVARLRAELEPLRVLWRDALLGLDGEMGSDAGDSSIVEACVEWSASVRRLPEEMMDPENDTLQEIVEKLLGVNSDLSAKLEASERAAKNLDEKLHSRDLELAELSAELERRQPVDRSAAIEAVLAKLEFMSRDEAYEAVTAVLGASKAEPPAFVPSPTGEAPSDVTTECLDSMMFRNTWTMTEMQVCSFEDAKRVAKTDIRTNVARERGKWEADHAAQVKRVRELEGAIDDAGNILGIHEPFDSASVLKEVRYLQAENERLQAEASRPCPADGMSDHEIGIELKRAEQCRCTQTPWSAVGAKARELFGKGKP